MQGLFWLLIFLLPVQLGKHFWPEWSYVLGLRIDYLSPTIYLTDILVLAILGLWGVKNFKILLVFLFLLASCFLVQNQGAAFYKFIKIIEFSLLGVWLVKEKIKFADITFPLSLAVIYSSLIAIAQFLKQASLGGIFYWLGERSFNVSTPGIAKAVFQGRLLMRPYATFSHPNVLAGFILISLILIFPITCHLSPITKILRWPTLVLGIMAIVLSFSRSAWLGGGLVILLFILLHPFSNLKKAIALGVWQEEFFWQRMELNKIAFQMIKAKPLLGVGLNNFIPQLPDFLLETGFTYWLQPVHNIFLLTTAETGLIGLLIFLWFLFLIFKKLFSTQNKTLIIALSTILFLGLFDHYWLTLQQAQLLFSIVLGLAWRNKNQAYAKIK